MRGSAAALAFTSFADELLRVIVPEPGASRALEEAPASRLGASLVSLAPSRPFVLRGASRASSSSDDESWGEFVSSVPSTVEGVRRSCTILCGGSQCPGWRTFEAVDGAEDDVGAW